MRSKQLVFGRHALSDAIFTNINIQTSRFLPVDNVPVSRYQLSLIDVALSLG